MTDEEKMELAMSFAVAVKTQNRKLLQSLLTDDVVWNLPGTSLMSGQARGVDGIFKRAEILNSYGVTVKVEHIIIGYKDVGLLLHNTGNHGGKILDEHLTTIFILRENKIERLESLISDVPMLNAYFA
ncbi:hypothetical protein [Granulicella mallensis]|uniref:SnoaL-like domain-containing protein n=2 Tax=Granulicella mallensis TaxID=940614 RepID=G8P0F2_GRAMM|nr:hypothetical protein [Granulicella mallensis]AEU38040.1 hypothetical protein AciX8_3756 [Granulicella mallensis MP5ACTX8]MBB5066741.1 hypothetical protein [Granulicella mallensis]